MCGKTGFLACLLLGVSAQGQVLLSADQARRVNHTMDAGVKGERLNCHIEPVKPFLDFAFRFELGYIVRCPVNEFGGPRQHCWLLPAGPLTRS